MRAVLRWGWRLLRRDWRQQLLVLALLTVAVAAASLSVSAAYGLVPSADARFGTANHRLDFDATGPGRLDAIVSDVRAWFGTVELIGRRPAPVPGSVETVELRTQDPHGAYSGPMLRLREGRYPAAAGEVAVTDRVAATFQVGVGGTLALGGSARTVVGLVENPSDLNDEFAMTAPLGADPPASVTMLIQASPERATALPGGYGGRLEARPACHAVLCLTPGQSERATAAVAGTALAAAGWIAVAPRLEAPARHRIDRFDLPWWLIGAGMLLAVVTATAAAWWPARTVARVPVTQALSARPPQPRPAHRSAVAAGLLAVIGVVCLAVGIDPRRDQANPVLVVSGTVAVALAILLASPLAIRVLAAAAARSPISARLALRDLARYQARSGAALAAISLALGIAVAAVIAAAAAEHTAGEGNLSDRQLLFRVGDAEPLIPERTPAELARLRSESIGSPPRSATRRSSPWTRP